MSEIQGVARIRIHPAWSTRYSPWTYCEVRLRAKSFALSTPLPKCQCWSPRLKEYLKSMYARPTAPPTIGEALAALKSQAVNGDERRC
jgi:hypothetical protein